MPTRGSSGTAFAACPPPARAARSVLSQLLFLWQIGAIACCVHDAAMDEGGRADLMQLSMPPLSARLVIERVTRWDRVNRSVLTPDFCAEPAPCTIVVSES
jgi:hypothetical protein